MTKEEIKAELADLREKQKKVLSLFIHDNIERGKAEQLMAALNAKIEALEAE